MLELIWVVEGILGLIFIVEEPIYTGLFSCVNQSSFVLWGLGGGDNTNLSLLDLFFSHEQSRS